MLVARDGAVLRDVVEEIERKGGQAAYVVADVGNLDEVKAAVRQLVLPFGVVLILPRRRRREAVVVEIERGRVQVIGRAAEAPARDARAMGALSRHARKIAHMGRRLNDAILRHSLPGSGG